MLVSFVLSINSNSTLLPLASENNNGNVQSPKAPRHDRFPPLFGLQNSALFLTLPEIIHTFPIRSPKIIRTFVENNSENTWKTVQNSI